MGLGYIPWLPTTGQVAVVGPDTIKMEDATGVTPMTQQIGGRHYKDLSIQPVEYIHANGLSYFEGNVIKYVTRWREKGGLEDLEKAKHYLALLIEFETNAQGNEGVRQKEGEGNQAQEPSCT